MKTIDERYTAAEQFMPWNTAEDVLNADLRPLPVDEKHFAYARQIRKDQKVRTEWILVNTDDGSTSSFFDADKVRKALNDPDFDLAMIGYDHGTVRFTHAGKPYAYDPASETLTNDPLHAMRAVSLSPDASKELYVEEYDLYLRDNETGEVTRLTYDGEKDFAYGDVAQYSGWVTQRVQGLPEIPDVCWSPDGKHFITVKLDQRNVKELFVIQSYDDPHTDSIRPRLWTYKCGFPEDEYVPLAYYYIGDVETKTMIKVDMDPQECEDHLLAGRFTCCKWMDDSSAFYTAIIARAHRYADMYVVDLEGHAEHLVHEETDTFLNMRTYGGLDGFGSYTCSHYLTDERKYVIFQSERDNFAALFRYDAKTKELLNKVTPDDIIVGAIVAKDDAKEKVWYMASHIDLDEDPYLQYLCVSSYDGKEFEIITKDPGMHRCKAFNDCVLDTCSDISHPQVHKLYKLDGTLLCTLEKADASRLYDKGFVTPEKFTVKCSDGKHTLHGILVKPADFDPEKTYPMIDYIYGGMQCYNVPKDFPYRGNVPGREILGGLQSLAQLGFVGIILDGIGTPGQGKDFHDDAFQNIHGCAGLKDHVYCLPELKEKYPFIDLDKLGMWGNSGGGCATSRALLEYPDTYKVGVSSAGNHDQRMYANIWTENYYGLYDKDIYLPGDNTALAKNLKGHLFIVHGAMDDNVANSESMRLIDALIKEEKDFDFLLLPRVNHNVPADPYFLRKRNDYFVRWLLEEEPSKLHFPRP